MNARTLRSAFASRTLLTSSALIACLILAACASMPVAEIIAPTDADTSYRLRYADGQVSVNDRCAVQLNNRLNPKMPPLYVNGRPIGFC